MAQTDKEAWIAERQNIIERAAFLKQSAGELEEAINDGIYSEKEELKRFYDFCRASKELSREAQLAIQIPMPDETSADRKKYHELRNTIHSAMWNSTSLYDYNDNLERAIKMARPNQAAAIEKRQAETYKYRREDGTYGREHVKDPAERAAIDAKIAERKLMPAKSNITPLSATSRDEGTPNMTEITPGEQVKPEIASTVDEDEMFSEADRTMPIEDIMASFGIHEQVKPEIAPTVAQDDEVFVDAFADISDEELLATFNSTAKPVETAPSQDIQPETPARVSNADKAVEAYLSATTPEERQANRDEAAKRLERLGVKVPDELDRDVDEVHELHERDMAEHQSEWSGYGREESLKEKRNPQASTTPITSPPVIQLPPDELAASIDGLFEEPAPAQTPEQAMRASMEAKLAAAQAASKTRSR
jgi:hypothetical protein